MLRLSIICLSGLLVLASAQPAGAWPETAYSEIFANATRVLPPALRQLLEDMESSLHQSCLPAQTDQAAAQTIEELRSPNGNLARAVTAMKDAGCAVAAMNDPKMDRLVESERENFAVVFYGWHPIIADGNLTEYLRIREAEHQRLLDRFGRSSQLPNRSANVELSPEFGMASIAFSHAVTDVANVWLYIWTSVNGALD